MIIVATVILLCLGCWLLINWGCVIPSRKGIRFWLVLAFSSTVAVAFFWAGQSLGRQKAKIDFYCGARREISLGLSALAVDVNDKNHDAIEKKIEHFCTQWNDVWFFHDDPGFKDHSYRQLVEGLEK